MSVNFLIANNRQLFHRTFFHKHNTSNNKYLLILKHWMTIESSQKITRAVICYLELFQNWVMMFIWHSVLMDLSRTFFFL